jgi:hypothetical protein
MDFTLPISSPFIPPVWLELCFLHAFFAAFIASFLPGAYPLAPPQPHAYQPVVLSLLRVKRLHDDGVGNSTKIIYLIIEFAFYQSMYKM